VTAAQPDSNSGQGAGDQYELKQDAYGKRPTFLLTRDRDDARPAVTLFELVQTEIVEARRRRFGRNASSKNVTTRPIENCIVGGDAPEALAEGQVPTFGWEDRRALVVGKLTGARYAEATHLIRETVSGAGLDASTVTTGSPGTVALAEASGIRLAIGVRALSRVRRRDKLHAISRGVRNMGESECYYWHAKIRSPAQDSAAKALRTLFAGGVE